MSSTTTQIHPSRLSQVPKPKSKPHKKRPSKPQPASTTLTRAQLRKKIRDLTRLLNPSSTTSKLPATTRADHERALSAYKHELHLQQTSTKRHTLEKRYHKVRFFERRKATRALSRLSRELAALSSSFSSGNNNDDSKDEKDQLLAKIHTAEIDLNYIMHYPPLEKYISLYKSGDDKDTNQKRERIRLDIEKRMADGTLEKGDALVEANAADGFGGGVDGKKKNDKKQNGGSNDNDRRKGDKRNNNSRGAPAEEEDNNDEDDEGSDGGFFEL